MQMKLPPTPNKKKRQGIELVKQLLSFNMKN